MIFQEVLKDVGDVGQSKTESERACGAEGTEEERCQVTSVQVDLHGNTVRLDSAVLLPGWSRPSVPAKECSPFILPLS